MNCTKCERQLTPITTVIPVEYEPQYVQKYLTTTPNPFIKNIPPKFKKGMKLRRGMSNYRACKPCDKIYHILPTNIDHEMRRYNMTQWTNKITFDSDVNIWYCDGCLEEYENSLDAIQCENTKECTEKIIIL